MSPEGDQSARRAARLISLVHSERARLLARRRNSPTPCLWDLLDAVDDPEVPALTIWQLGVLQDVRLESGEVTVVVTPTYTGCPAMDRIEQDIRQTLADAGFTSVQVHTRLSPAWSTDWLDEAAKSSLRKFGIAPPAALIECPRCGSDRTETISEFGSTACKALCRCLACREVFDYFKPF